MTAFGRGSAGGGPAGSDQQVQFNDGGSMGAAAGLAFNKTTGALAAAFGGIGSNPGLRFVQTVGYMGLWPHVDGLVHITSNGVSMIAFDTRVSTSQLAVLVASAGQFAFASGSDTSTFARDTGLARSSAGVVKVTDGSSGRGGMDVGILNVYGGAGSQLFQVNNGALAGSAFKGRVYLGDPVISGGLEYEDQASPVAGYMFLGDASRHLVIAAYINRGGAANYNHPQQTNPTLFIHSQTGSATATNEWLGLTHNGTDAKLSAGKGGLDLTATTGGVKLDRTITAAGTTGAQTINKLAGTVNAAAGATSLVVTNSLVTTNSIVFCVIRTNDSTAAIKSVVPAAGSFTINFTGSGPTAETSVGFLVTN